MIVALVISIILTVIAVVILFAGFVWAAREDGRFQEEHDRFVTRRWAARSNRRAPDPVGRPQRSPGSEVARRRRRQRH